LAKVKEEKPIFEESKLIKDLRKTLKDEVSIGFDDILTVKEWYSTGSKMLDMQLNGGYLNKGGIPAGKLTVFAGLRTCGKTYFAIQAAIDFLNKKENGYVYYFDSERNISFETFLNAGLDESKVNRVVIIPVNTYEKFRTKMVKIFDFSKEHNIDGFLILDSVGGLITEKAYIEAHAESDKNGISDIKVAMGRPQQTIKELTKIAIHDGGTLRWPMIFIAHVYKDTNAPNPKYAGNIVSGGEGIGYFNSTLVEFSRSKSKDEKIENKTIHDINGILVRSKLTKSRLAREETIVHSLIHFNYGVVPYYGFVSMLEQAGWIKKEGTKYIINDGKYSIRELNKNDELLKPLLEQLQNWTIAQFGLGKMSLNTNLDDFIKPETTLDFEDINEDENIFDEAEEA